MTILELLGKGMFLVVVTSVLTTGNLSGHIDIHTTLTSGAGNGYMKVIISSTGNVWYFQAPAGASHISTGKAYVAFEGYTVCGFSESPSAWDLGSSESGWGAPTITQPNGANTVPLTIKRTTTNGKLELKQIFTRDTARQELKIEMTVKNVSNGSLSQVLMKRWHDADVNGIRENAFLGTGQYLLGIGGGGKGFLMSPWSNVGSANASRIADYFEGWNPLNTSGRGRECGISFSAGGGDGDYVGGYWGYYQPLNPGASKTIKLLYKGIP